MKVLEQEAKDLKPEVSKAESQVKRLEILATTEKNRKSKANVEKVAQTAKEELDKAKTKLLKK